MTLTSKFQAKRAFTPPFADVLNNRDDRSPPLRAVSPASTGKLGSSRRGSRRGSVLSFQRQLKLEKLGAQLPRTPSKYDVLDSSAPMEVSKEAAYAAFCKIDRDGDEHITREDLEIAVKKNALAISPTEITEMIKSADSDNSGKLTFQQMYAATAFRKEYRASALGYIDSGHRKSIVAYSLRPHRKKWISIVNALSASRQKFAVPLFEKKNLNLHQMPVLTLQERSQFKPSWIRRGSQAQLRISTRRPSTTGGIGYGIGSTSPPPLWSAPQSPSAASIGDFGMESTRRKRSFAYPRVSTTQLLSKQMGCLPAEWRAQYREREPSRRMSIRAAARKCSTRLSRVR